MSLNPDLIQARCAEIDTSLSRLEAIRRAHRDHGYSLSEIGHVVGLHYATISRIANPRDIG